MINYAARVEKYFATHSDCLLLKGTDVNAYYFTGFKLSENSWVFIEKTKIVLFVSPLDSADYSKCETYATGFKGLIDYLRNFKKLNTCLTELNALEYIAL